MAKLKVKKRLIPYARWSTDKQTLGKSDKRQEMGFKAYAREHEYVIDATLTYCDPGVSGYTGKNLLKGDMGRIIQDIDQGKILPGDAVWIDSWDRATRWNPAKAVEYFQKYFFNKGIAIITARDEVIYSQQAFDEDSQLFKRLVALLDAAHESSKFTSRALSKTNEIKRNELRDENLTCLNSGEKSALWGKSDKLLPFWLTNEEVNGVIKAKLIPEKVETVLLIIDLALKGDGTTTIALKLNQKDLKAPRGGNWSSNQVYQILRNPALIGQSQPKKRRRGDWRAIPDGKPLDNLPSIISFDSWVIIQKQLNERSINKGRRSKDDKFVFGDKLISGYSGHRMLKFRNSSDYVRSRGSRELKTENSSAWQLIPLTNSFIHSIIHTEFDELSNSVDSDVNTANIDIVRKKIDLIERGIENASRSLDLATNDSYRSDLSLRINGYYDERDKLYLDLEKEKKKINRNQNELRTNLLRILSDNYENHWHDGKIVNFNHNQEIIDTCKKFINRYVKTIECFPDGINTEKEKDWLFEKLKNRDLNKFIKDAEEDVFSIFDYDEDNIKINNTKEAIEKTFSKIKLQYNKPFIKINYLNDVQIIHVYNSKANAPYVEVPIRTRMVIKDMGMLVELAQRKVAQFDFKSANA